MSQFSQSMHEYELLPYWLHIDGGDTGYSERGMLERVLGGVAHECYGDVSAETAIMTVQAIACAHAFQRDPAEAVAFLRDNYPDTPVDLIGGLVTASEELERLRLVDDGYEVEEVGYDGDHVIYARIESEE